MRWSTSSDQRECKTANHNTCLTPKLSSLCVSVGNLDGVYVGLRFVLQIRGLVEQLQYELVFLLAVLFWWVVVACHVARLGQTLSLAQECGHAAACSQRSEDADP